MEGKKCILPFNHLSCSSQRAWVFGIEASEVTFQHALRGLVLSSKGQVSEGNSFWGTCPLTATFTPYLSNRGWPPHLSRLDFTRRVHGNWLMTGVVNAGRGGHSNEVHGDCDQGHTSMGRRGAEGRG